MLVKLIHIDGSLPNMALMKLAHWHRAHGHQVQLTRRIHPRLGDPEPDLVYVIRHIREVRPPRGRDTGRLPGNAIVGGTGTDNRTTVEATIGLPRYENYDYSAYPRYPWSMGMTQRGCRLSCKFCVVPVKEGKPRFNATIEQIWRPGTARNIMLLDNDFFGQNEDDWRARTEELRQGNFKVSFTQGVNVRMITEGNGQGARHPRTQGQRVRETPPLHRLGQPPGRVNLLPWRRAPGKGRHPAQADNGLHARGLRQGRDHAAGDGPLRQDPRPGLSPLSHGLRPLQPRPLRLPEMGDQAIPPVHTLAPVFRQPQPGPGTGAQSPRRCNYSYPPYYRQGPIPPDPTQP